MSKIFYPAVFLSEEGGYFVRVPDIDGCYTQGSTIEDAYNMAVDAIGLCLEELEAQNLPYPQASTPAAVIPELGEFIVLITFDPIAYQRKNDTHAVKKTLTIPSWLNSLAEEKHINFSKTLKTALLNQLGVST